MLTVYHSNRFERLADRLAAVVGEPLPSPLASELIVVQSNGMARWLALHLARRLGVCANVRFPFPAAFVWEAFRAVLPGVPEDSPFAPAVLSWRLMSLLAELEEAPCFRPLRAYLGDGDAFRRYELAWRIADQFDQYLVYRPDWIARWEQGEDDHWQAELWRRLAAGERTPHRVRLAERFFQALDGAAAPPPGLPARLSLIGIPAMPPVYLEVLSRLAVFMDVHLFLLNPCREYWGDIVAERDIARRAVDVDAEALYLETGNSLLASLGKQGRDFIDLVQEHPGRVEELFEEPQGDSLLHCLQADILALRNRGTGDCPAAPVRPDDRSVQVHACHGPMREVEVLHDQLLALLAADPELRPADIAVMTPDIEAYAPTIEAVFATAEGERRIPFSIADRGVRAESPLVDAFFGLLDLPRSRFDANRVLGLLEAPTLRRAFNLADADLVLAHRWVRETTIRWGIDEAARVALDLPPTREHTWRAGLDRLLAGYALPGGNSRLFADILSYDDLEGSDAQVMGRLTTFAEAVFGLTAALEGRRPVAAWVETLLGMLERFFLPVDGEEAEAQGLREALAALAQGMDRAGFGEAVPLEVVKAGLRRALEAPEGQGRFLAGGVTFCAMVPMRSVPFEVVCLIGMNDDCYPRPHRPPGFDLMARYFRKGDRSRRNDDRYLFLEALLSARRCLYISYVGNDIRDNSVIPPSVLVSELLDTVARGFYPGEDRDGDLRERIVTRHPLQPFSRRYFSADDPRLFSYSQALCEAGRLAGWGEGEPAPLIATELPEPDDEWRTVELDSLIRFCANPARYLLRRRLGVHLEEGEGLLETREPFTLDRPAATLLRERLLSLHLAGEPPAGMLPLLRAAGALPHGRVGEVLFQREWAGVERFAERLAAVRPPAVLEPLAVDLSLGDRRLTGWLRDVSTQGILSYRLAKVRPRDRLDLWLRHLVLNCLVPAGVEPVSRWLGEDEEVTLHPVAEDPRPYLQDLLAHYWRGLSRPLHFFPKSTLAYAKAARKGSPDPLREARKEWEGSEDHLGERDRDPYYQFAFRGSDPLDAEFATLAEAVFGPMLDHSTEQE